MKNKKFFYLFLGIIGGIVISVSLANYYIDYYSVFRGAQKKIIETNAANNRFVKMEYLLMDNHFKKYDSYLWGSSRVEKMDTRLTGQRTYNMGASAGMPEDCLRELKILKAHNAPVDVVYLGIDDFAYFTDYDDMQAIIYQFPYEEGSPKYEYYIRLLLEKELIKLKVEEMIKPSVKGKIMLQQTGTYLVPQVIEKQIEENVLQYVQDNKFKKATRFKFGGNARFDKCLVAIKKIKSFCDENNIQFVPFFNPQHMTTYLADDMELMNRFKRELVKISPFWDFSGVNYVTANNYFWSETSHARPFICDKILDTVSGQNQMTWVPDFGVYVTEDNVDAFCEKAVRDREAYDPDHEQWIPTAEERAIMTKRVNYPW